MFEIKESFHKSMMLQDVGAEMFSAPPRMPEGSESNSDPTRRSVATLALGYQLGGSTPNCSAYSAFSRRQPSNASASPPAMRPIGAPSRR